MRAVPQNQNSTFTSMVEQITKDIQSLLKDQQRCVSVGDSIRLGVSRFQLASLLQQQQQEDSRTAMRCESTKDSTAVGIPVTGTKFVLNLDHTQIDSLFFLVFKMRKGSGKEDQPPASTAEESSSMVYAISQMESLSASQERRLADLRDRCKDHRLVQIDPERILPNPKFMRTTNKLDTPPTNNATSSVTVEAPKASLLLQRARKPTTALNYFKKEGKENGEKKKETPAPKPDRKRQANDTKKTTNKKTEKKTEKKGKPTTDSEEKEKTVGSVDDFQGDMDDDDDDSSVEAPRKPKSPKKKAKTAAVAPVERKAKPAYDGPIAKRRRKVRKTKCTVDDKGYMVTEHYDEWEDVPSDEEEAPPKAVPKKKPAAKAKSSLKQGSLTGFFKKA